MPKTKAADRTSKKRKPKRCQNGACPNTASMWDLCRVCMNSYREMAGRLNGAEPPRSEREEFRGKCCVVLPFTPEDGRGG